MTVSLLAVRDALRARAVSTIVATTPSTTMSVDVDGFTRATGSFIDDNFSIGMEVIVSGFPSADNGTGIVSSLSDSKLGVQLYTIANGKVTFRLPIVASSDVGRTIVATTPAVRTFESNSLIGVTGVPYLEEEFVPATSGLKTTPARSGQVQDDGLMIYKWWGLPRVGDDALYRSGDAMKAMFSPRTALVAGDYTVGIGQSTGAQYGQILRFAGWNVLVITIPWDVRSRNTILS